MFIPSTQDLQRLTTAKMSSRESWHALQLLSDSMKQNPSSGPTLDLIRCHSKLSRSLREASTADDLGDRERLVEDTAELIKKTYGSMGDFISSKPDAALRLTDVEKYVSHAYLKDFVGGFTLPLEQRGKRKPVISIALPNGPLLAAVCIAVTSNYIASPVNPAAGPQQFQADILQAGARCILTTKEDYTKLQLEGGWTQDNDILVLLVDLSDDMKISLTTPDGTPIFCEKPAVPNAPDDIALILFTSGTSGTKKVVPLTTHSIVAGVAFVIDSWAMTESDVCLNMMPLYHVGGLIRNIFAPIFAGGSTICCPAFDPNGFWDMVETTLPTWYYASPSMHSVILAESKHRPEALRKNKIRLVCNAAGGLLPSLATQLRDTFGSVVLPSYGMTECMPISTPPVDYKLDRPGTSGISTGPDLAILDFNFKRVPSGNVGRICVRGEPLFPGYLRPDGTIDKSAMSEDGWFDTGDMGYMDDDEYLYITGRSKEVINRGGELISPFEVENAIVVASNQPHSPLHGRVSQALAFSAQHDVLQEVVGVVLVCPRGVPRPDLKLLHSSLKSSLQQLKWPTVIVYMDDLPKNNNKVLRIRLAERLALPKVEDETPYLSRHWEGICPKADTPLTTPIESFPCNVDLNIVWNEIASIMPSGASFCIRMNPEEKTISAILAPSGPDRPPLDDQLPGYIREKLLPMVHGYMMPQKMQVLQAPLPTDINGDVDDVALQRILAEVEASAAAAGDGGFSMKGRVIKAFASVLNLSVAEIPSDGDFFDLGGDSLKAGRLLSVLRADFNIHIPIDAIFQHGSPSLLSAYIRERLPPDWENSSGSGTKDEGFLAEGCEKTYSSTRWWLMFLQLIPMCVIYPLRRAFQWSIFIVFLASTQQWRTAQYVPGRLLNLTVSILVARIITNAVTPWFGIAAKWLLIGRFKEGLYPMWGPYHTRWWMVQKTVDICGQGLFKQTNFTSVLYLRLMGAKIGKGVTIKGAQMGEWDLLEIGDDAILERCIVRPFAGERNTSMYLGKVRIGRNATVGLSSIVAPGTTIPDNACMGPNSSSWEVEDADESNRDLLSSKIPGAHWLLDLIITKPMVVIAWIISLIPWFAGLIGLVMSEPIGSDTPLYSILMWFAATNRVGYHYLALVLRVSVGPFILFGFTVVVKWILDVIIGKMQPGPVQGRSQLQTWRMSFMKALYPVKSLHGMTELTGQHYEATSVAVRMLGGRVGNRVYWPGTGPSIGDYHLIDIGNDVVFGSRAHLITSDGLGSEMVKVEDRAMIADRVTLLPGVTVGEKTIMGSGALTSRNKFYNNGGTYVGSKKGDAVCLSVGTSTPWEESQSDASRSSSDMAINEGRMDIEANMEEKSRISTTRVRARSNNHGDMRPEETSPFGRAFYFKQAPYRVYGMGMIVFYSAALTVFTAFYWNVPSITSIQVVARIFRDNHQWLGKEHLLARAIWPDTGVLYALFFLFVSAITTAQAVLAIAAVIAAKWILLGRRTAGNYDWDKSPYCQNWQLYLTIEKLRRYCYRGHGILGMLTGTHWLVLYFRALGGNIGDNCALFANGRPSLMFTEPDLITIGDRTVIDDASVVAHINTRGKFDLNRLEIGERCVMRTGSRLLSGAVMRDDSALLEHTLIMGGDVVEKGCTMQGWPADRFKGSRVKLPDTIEGRRAGNGDESSTAATSRMDLSSDDGGKKA